MKTIPWAQPKLTREDISSVNKTLKSNWISGGNQIENFEKNICKFVKTKYACVTSNGTSALHLAFLSLDLKPNDEIIVPGFGYMAAANIGKLMGLKIIFADVCENSFCVSLKNIKKVISKRTKLIVVTHTYGNINEIDDICKFAKKNKILVVEDCAESLGSEYKKKHCGTFGDIGTFSFHATKTITTGEGGAVCTKSKKIYQKLKLFRSHGVKKKRYLHYVPGHNFRLTNFQCALGNSQLKRIKKIKENRKKIYNLYCKNFSNKNFSTQKFSKKTSANYWTFSIFLNNSFTKKKRDDLINSLNKRGIETRNGFYSANEINYFKYKKKLNFSKTFSDRIINLPIFEELTKKQVNFISNTFLDLINK